MTDKYYYLEAQIPAEFEYEIDVISRNEFNCQGIEEFSIEEAKVDEILGERSYSGGDVPESVIDDVIGVMEAEKTAKKYYFIDEAWTNKFKIILGNKYQISSTVCVEDIKDWNTEWRKSYEPILINKDFSIIPSWEKENYSNLSENLFIYPGQGFGTGSHETTFLCMKFFVENLVLYKKINSCLDFGCGSGILGLAVLKFDSEAEIDLYDIDENALENSKQNIDLNDFTKAKIKLLLPNAKGEIQKKYDLVFANILQNVLLLEAKFLANSLTDNGSIILSGLLSGQELEVIDRYLRENSKLKHIETKKKGDWVAVLLEQR